MSQPATAELKEAIIADDRTRVGVLLEEHPDLRSALHEPMFRWGIPGLAGARSAAMVDLLVARGGDPEIVARWWAPGIGLSGDFDPVALRRYAEHGAALTPHAAAALGMTAAVTEMLDADLDAIHAKGIDECTPLHFALDPATAALLLERGADIDARDADHDSTPAQWLVGERPDVSRFLLERGATPDLFLAAALDDRALAQRLIADDPTRLARRIGKAPFHAIGHERRGGSILQWTVGFNTSAHRVAWRRGHRELFEILWDASDSTTRLLVACTIGLRERAEAIVAEEPGLVAGLGADDLVLLAQYCWETNADLEAVRLMLDVGFPVDHPEHHHGYTPLHNAAWGGYAEIVELLIERGHPVDLRDREHKGTPLDWALHCCLHDGRHPEGAYPRVVELLIEAGCPWDRKAYPTGHEGMDAVFASHV